MPAFTSLAIGSPDKLLYGVAPRPVETRDGLVIGGGLVYPELNFTLPPMLLGEATMPDAERHYRQIIEGALGRAAALHAPGVVVEFEALPPMTECPDWGMRIVSILLEGMARARDTHGLRTALRVTPNDNREMVRPPLMRSGPHWEAMLDFFDRAAAAGAEFLSIESTGGKEVHDDALLMCDLPQCIFALCVMGVRDMRLLWTALSGIGERHGVRCAGDTACGFGNTAMVLAEQGMIPRVFAAVLRAVTAVRSLVAYECGAVGPGKDCGYENVYLKAITGCPMSLEGKAAACAHLSPVGNIAAAACDLWSNESVQNIKLLGAMAPTVSMEQLIYDCRLLNRAARDGEEARRQLRDWLVDSDAPLDPQAFVLCPESAIRIARAIVEADGHYAAGCAAARAALDLLVEGARDGRLRLSERERPWLDRMSGSLDGLPGDEDEFVGRMMAVVDTSRFRASEYGLPAV